MRRTTEDRLEEAIVLCGGLATRLRGVVDDRPKALVPILGRPFLEWLILALARRHDIRRVVLATGYLGSQIETHFGSSTWCGVAVTYSREEAPLGTGGALRRAASVVASQTLLALNGDTYCQFDSNRLLNAHTRSRARATLWLAPAEEPGKYGRVIVDDAGKVLRFDEKPDLTGRHLASAGVYLIEREVAAMISPEGQTSLEREVFPSLVGNGLYAVAGNDPFFDIGTPESLKTSDKSLAAELSGLDCE